MFLQKDALVEFDRICKSGVSIAPIEIEGRTDRVWVRGPDGTLTQQDVPLPPPELRAYEANSVEGFCQQVLHLAPKFKDAGGVAVFVGAEANGRGKIAAVLGEHERREEVVMELVPHPAAVKLAEWEADNGCEIEQRDLLWLLRTTFANAVQPASFVPAIRQVKFRVNTAADSSVQIGRESMGKSVDAEMVQGSDAVGEELQLKMPVYTNVREEAGPAGFVVCQLDILIGKQKFKIKPWAGEVTARREAANRAIAATIRTKLGEAAVVFESSTFAVVEA